MTIRGRRRLGRGALTTSHCSEGSGSEVSDLYGENTGVLLSAAAKAGLCGAAPAGAFSLGGSSDRSPCGLPFAGREEAGVGPNLFPTRILPL